MPCPSHPPWLDHSNYTWRRVQVMKFLTSLLLDGGEWSPSRPGRFTSPWKIDQGANSWVGGWVDPQSRSGRRGVEKNSLPQPGIKSQPFSPSLYQLNYGRQTRFAWTYAAFFRVEVTAVCWLKVSAFQEAVCCMKLDDVWFKSSRIAATYATLAFCHLILWLLRLRYEGRDWRET
jgi:hypothetical protein